MKFLDFVEIGEFTEKFNSTNCKFDLYLKVANYEE